MRSTRRARPDEPAPREPTASSIAWGVVIAVGAAGVAGIALYRDRVPDRVLEVARRLDPAVRAVRMTQSELAQMLGMSRPNVNRLLSEFESRGWLDWNEGRPVLLRPDLIVQSAG